MGNTVLQNPQNKVGRNSGAGPAGISEIAPTEAEMRRGVQSLSVGGVSGWIRPLGMGLGVLAMLGAGMAAYRVQQERRSLRGRIQRMVRMR